MGVVLKWVWPGKHRSLPPPFQIPSYAPGESSVSASMAQSRWPPPPVCYLATMVFPRVSTVVFP